MPVNPTYEYELAEKKFFEAITISEKIKALEEMLSTCPSHKGAENLRSEIKQRISRYRKLLEKERHKKKGRTIGVKKEGAAQVVLVGTTNSGKSTLLNRLTGSKVKVADYEFTTLMPEQGMMDYNGIKIQIVEIPAITENFLQREKGPLFMSIIRSADLIVIMYKNNAERKLILNELKNVDVKKIDNSENIKEDIWKSLGLVYVFTKAPGKEKKWPPVALDKNFSVGDLALRVHKDFIKKFDYAIVYGKSSKFKKRQRVGLNHVLENGDVVELHMK